MPSTFFVYASESLSSVHVTLKKLYVAHFQDLNDSIRTVSSVQFTTHKFIRRLVS